MVLTAPKVTRCKWGKKEDMAADEVKEYQDDKG